MDKVIFAVYGTLKQGHYNHYLLEGAKPLGTHITEPQYSLFDGGFPVVERGGDTAIHCELFEATDKDMIKNIFRLEGCPSRVQGHPTNWYDFDKIQTPHGEAVIFVMDKGTSNRSQLIESGIWR